MARLQTRYNTLHRYDDCCLCRRNWLEFSWFAGSDGIFPSVPGMGAAFITHFIANAIRTPENSPLGRFSIPDGRTIGIAAIVLLVPFSAGEVAYYIGKPDSSSMGGTGRLSGRNKWVI